jgi:hypothetical protein
VIDITSRPALSLTQNDSYLLCSCFDSPRTLTYLPLRCFNLFDTHDASRWARRPPLRAVRSFLSQYCLQHSSRRVFRSASCETPRSHSSSELPSIVCGCQRSAFAEALAHKTAPWRVSSCVVRPSLTLACQKRAGGEFSVRLRRVKAHASTFSFRSSLIVHKPQQNLRLRTISHSLHTACKASVFPLPVLCCACDRIFLLSACLARPIAEKKAPACNAGAHNHLRSFFRASGPLRAR